MSVLIGILITFLVIFLVLYLINMLPLDGRANAAVIELIAERLGVRASLLHVAAGESSRDKRIELAGGALTPDEVVLKLRPG